LSKSCNWNGFAIETAAFVLNTNGQRYISTYCIERKLDVDFGILLPAKPCKVLILFSFNGLYEDTSEVTRAYFLTLSPLFFTLAFTKPIGRVFL